jgi:inosine/xanthosine triphosphate pyrophosphatase family protein
MGYEVVEGFPFRPLFWIDELQCSLADLHTLGMDQKKGFMNHREKAFIQFFGSLETARTVDSSRHIGRREPLESPV